MGVFVEAFRLVPRSWSGAGGRRPAVTLLSSALLLAACSSTTENKLVGTGGSGGATGGNGASGGSAAGGSGAGGSGATGGNGASGGSAAGGSAAGGSAAGGSAAGGSGNAAGDGGSGAAGGSAAGGSGNAAGASGTGSGGATGGTDAGADTGDAATRGSPCAVSACVLWLRADLGITTSSGGSVRAWADQSGQSHDVSAETGSEPTLDASAANGLPAIQFPAAKYLHNTTANLMAAASSKTVMLIGRAAGAGGAYLTLRRAAPTESFEHVVAGATYYVYSAGTPNDYANFWVTSVAEHDPLKTKFFVSVATTTAGAPASGSLSLRVDKSIKVLAEIVDGAPQTDGVTGFTVGDREDVTGFTWGGHIAELAVWDHQLSPAEIDAVEDYAGQRYGL